jgi:hypothetical protein
MHKLQIYDTYPKHSIVLKHIYIHLQTLDTNPKIAYTPTNSIQHINLKHTYPPNTAYSCVKHTAPCTVHIYPTQYPSPKHRTHTG